MDFLIMCIVIAVLFLFFSLVYYIMQYRRYESIRKHEIEIFSKTSIPKDIAEAAILLSNRKFRYIQNYFVFLLTNKVFGLVSITYSILGLISLALEEKGPSTYHWLGYIVCFVSIIFVVLALYLTPISKVSQYISAWRMCDRKMCEVMASADYYASLKNNDKMNGYEYNNMDNNVIKSIKEIAVDITEVIADAEESLTTEGE